MVETSVDIDDRGEFIWNFLLSSVAPIDDKIRKHTR